MLVKCRILAFLDPRKHTCIDMQLYCSAGKTSSVSGLKYVFKNPCSDILASN
jgi:hypothetical protein